MNWQFALINGRLVELFFEKEKGIVRMLGHAYVKRSEYKTKREQKMIDADLKKMQFRYRKKRHTYMNSVTGDVFHSVSKTYLKGQEKDISGPFTAEQSEKHLRGIMKKGKKKK